MSSCSTCAHWEPFAGTKAAGHCETNRVTTLDLASCSAWADKAAATSIER